MGALNGGSAHAVMRGQRRLRARERHGVGVLMYRGQAGGVRVAELALLCFPSLGSSHYLVCPVLVGRVVEQGANVVDEEWVEQLSNLLLVGKIKSPVIRNPDTLEMHRANLDHVTNLLTLQDAVSTTSRHPRDVEQLCSVDHVVVYMQLAGKFPLFYF
jgi:hypothetical protein